LLEFVNFLQSVLDLLLSIVHGALSSLAFDGVIRYEKYDMPEFAMSGKPMELIVKKYGSLIEEIRTRILGIENNKSYLPFEIIKDVVSIKPSVSNEKYFTPAFDLLTDVVIMSGLASDMNSFEVRSRYFYVLATTESIDKVSSDTFDYEIYCVTGPYTFLINNVFYLIASGKYKYIYLVSNEKHYDKVKDTVPNDLYTRILNVTSEWDEYADRILTNLLLWIMLTKSIETFQKPHYPYKEGTPPNQLSTKEVSRYEQLNALLSKMRFHQLIQKRS